MLFINRKSYISFPLGKTIELFNIEAALKVAERIRRFRMASAFLALVLSVWLWDLLNIEAML